MTKKIYTVNCSGRALLALIEWCRDLDYDDPERFDIQYDRLLSGLNSDEKRQFVELQVVLCKALTERCADLHALPGSPPESLRRCVKRAAAVLRPGRSK